MEDSNQLYTYETFKNYVQQKQQEQDQKLKSLWHRSQQSPQNLLQQQTNDEDIYIQCLDWYSLDANYKDQYSRNFLIKAFGVDKYGKSYTVNITEFNPYIFIKPPQDLNNEHEYEKLLKTIRHYFNKENNDYQSKSAQQVFKNIKSVEVVKKRDLFYFNGLKEEYFFKFTFNTFQHLKQFKYFFSGKDEKLITEIDGGEITNKDFKVYEGNIEPQLRFMHLKNIVPSGWIKLPAFKYSYVGEQKYIRSKTSFDIKINYNDVQPYSTHDMAPFLVASYDIECVSLENRFPMAKKDWEKIINDFTNAGQNILNYIKNELYNRMDQEQGILPDNQIVQTEMFKETLLDDILYAFEPQNDKKQTIGVIQIDNIHNKFQSIEDIQNKIIEQYQKIHSYIVALLLNKEKKQIYETKRSFVKFLNNTFPKTMFRGDPCIQIGTTLHMYGQQKVQDKYIFTLDTCSQVPDTIVYAFKDEKDMIQSWSYFMKIIDADIITGYNIMGFDFKYIYERCEEIGIHQIIDEKDYKQSIHKVIYNEVVDNLNKLNLNDFSLYQRKASTIKSKNDCEYDEFMSDEKKFQNKSVFEIVKHTLASSALGSNEWYYIPCIGRVHMDVMKIVQKDFKLESYKLDNVAFHFTGERKDDITPKQMNAFQFQTCDKRALIAKYCVQDCALCNHLMIKLEMITNNIGMSNVCQVPISYLFLRGQSIKIYSLVADICRKQGYLIKDKSYIKEDSEDKYEGAIVFEPKIGLYLDTPVSVCDYGSLYPSSMIAENISHDTLIKEDDIHKFENEGYKINKVCYEVNGIQETKHYVTHNKDGVKIQGLMPIILQKLLKERKNTRKKIGYQTITLNNNQKQYTGLYSVNKDKTTFNVYDVDDNNQILENEPIENIQDKTDTFNAFQKGILNSHQLALKVSANSLYGQCGSRFSPIGLIDLAASTTAIGRQMLIYAKEFAEKHFNATCVYGDSVSPDTPILIKYPDETIDIVRMDEVQGKWEPYPNFLKEGEDKEKIEMRKSGIQVWSCNKWTPIIKMIRHKTQKQMYRVQTRQGIVDVTEDHSLADHQHQSIRPGECKIGETKLLHGFPTEYPERILNLPGYQYGNKVPEEIKKCSKCEKELPLTMFYKSIITIKDNIQKYTSQCKLCIKQKQCETQKRNYIDQLIREVKYYNIPEKPISEEEAYVMGAFYADGSCGEYQCPSGLKRSWAINKQDLTHLNKCKKYLEKTEDNNIVQFKILNTLQSSQVYKLVPTGEVRYMVQKYRPLFYDKEGYKKVPKQILNAPKNIQQSFMNGYLMGDGYKDLLKKDIYHFCSKGKLGAQGLYYLCKSLGRENININIQENKENIYFINQLYENTKITDWTQIKKMFKIPSQGIVYDIETLEGKFNAGVGQMTIHQTDSIFISFPDHIKPEMSDKQKLQTSIDTAIQLEKMIKPTMKEPQNLEYEKTFFPFISFAKKRYASVKYEFDINKGKIDWMGIILTRREIPQVSKKIYKGILDIILNQSDVEKSYRINQAIDYLQKELNKIINGEYPIEDFIQTKTLAASYKSTTIAHYELVQKIRKRNPGANIQINDRIPFVFIVTDNPEALDKDRIEDPDYILENKLQIDYKHYIKQIIAPPICQIFALSLDVISFEEQEYFGEYLQDYIEYERYREPEIDDRKMQDKVQEIKERIVMRTIFDPYLLDEYYNGTTIQSLTNYQKRGTVRPQIKLSSEEKQKFLERAPIQPEKKKKLIKKDKKKINQEPSSSTNE